MQKIHYWAMGAVVIVFIVAVLVWWLASEKKDRNDPLNKADAFVYKENDTIQWFILQVHRGKLSGTLYRQSVVEEVGQVPFMDEKNWRLSGKKTRDGYEFTIKDINGQTSYSAKFSNGLFVVLKNGEQTGKPYIAINDKQLNEYKQELETKLDDALYHMEEKEKNRVRKFFADLKSRFGYWATAKTKNGREAGLFIRFDEALLEGEVSGTLTVFDENETRYKWSGITDGLYLKIYTKADGEEVWMEGKFHGSASEFDLSVWLSGENVDFHAVTEEEYGEILSGLFPGQPQDTP